MEWFNILRARLRALFRRETVLRDIEEELRVHVEMETETNIEAAREIRIAFFSAPIMYSFFCASGVFSNEARKSSLISEHRSTCSCV